MESLVPASFFVILADGLNLILLILELLYIRAHLSSSLDANQTSSFLYIALLIKMSLRMRKKKQGIQSDEINTRTQLSSNIGSN